MYLWILFLHLLGVALLGAAGGIEVLGMARVLRAHDTAELRIAVTGARIVSRLFGLPLLLLIATGIALVVMSGLSWTTPWLIVSIVLLLIIAVSGPLVAGRKMRSLDAAVFASAGAAIDPAVDAARRDPALALVSGFGPVVVIALIFLMTNKPDLTGSIAAGALAVVVGIAFGLLRARR